MTSLLVGWKLAVSEIFSWWYDIIYMNKSIPLNGALLFLNLLTKLKPRMVLTKSFCQMKILLYG